MFKWVLGLTISLYAILILFGGEGYDPSKYAEAEPRASTNRVIETVEVTRAAVEPTAPAVPESTAEPIVVAEESATSDTDLITPIETASLDEKIEALVVEATEVVGEPETRPTLVLQPATQTAPAANAIQPDTGEVTAPVGEIWRVVGTRVNLRSGASTSNGVVGQTVRGDSAEIVEMLDNGWAKVYIIETGIEAYMAARFLERG